MQASWSDAKPHAVWVFRSASSILSLAPTPVPGDSVANIIEAMGFERAGTHGTTAALALLTDAVKKGGAMASGSLAE